MRLCFRPRRSTASGPIGYHPGGSLRPRGGSRVTTTSATSRWPMGKAKCRPNGSRATKRCWVRPSTPSICCVILHKASGVREAIEAAGAELRYLPPYSPDFNPIENLWSKVKGKLQSLAARGIDTLHDAIADALTTVTPADCVGFFRHCGYAATLERALL